MSHPDGPFWTFMHRLYLILFVASWPVVVFGHTHELLPYLNLFNVALVFTVLTPIVWAVSEYRSHRKARSQIGRGERGMYLVFFAVSLLILLYAVPGPAAIPDVTWTRVSVHNADGTPFQMPDRLKPLGNVIHGTVRTESLFEVLDADKLTNERRNNGYEDQKGNLQGLHYACFESTPMNRCPKAVSIKDDVKAFIGIYVLRPGAGIAERLPNIGNGKGVTTPNPTDSTGECRLLLLIFPLDKDASDRISRPNPEIDKVIVLRWN